MSSILALMESNFLLLIIHYCNFAWTYRVYRFQDIDA